MTAVAHYLKEACAMRQKDIAIFTNHAKMVVFVWRCHVYNEVAVICFKQISFATVALDGQASNVRSISMNVIPIPG